MQNENETLMNPDRVIAIVGMGCAFPRAHSPEAFWALVRDGRDTVEPVSKTRWGLAPDSLMSSGEPKPDRVYSLAGCFVNHADLELDWDRLAMTPASLAAMDPLFKVGLYAAQQAWFNAKTERVDKARSGVLIGNIVLPSEASSALCRETVGRAFETRVLGSRVARETVKTDHRNRFVAGLPAGFIANALGLGGGCSTLDAACASSLYAIHMAAEALRDGRADVMISGGLSRPDCLYTQMGFSQLRALSVKGWSSPFDQRADGLIVGEGAGFFVLKRLRDALDHGDTIHATIAGTGLSNDRDGSLLAPSSEGQLRAMRQAYRESRWQPDQVTMIECHATGTPLGDRVEFESLKALWQDAEVGRRAVIGSVKSNVGHLLTAAGAASLMKVVLAMRHQTLPPTARFEAAAEGIDLANSPFRILKQSEPWPGNSPRRAAVSAFGFGGINAHLLVAAWEAKTKLSQPPTSLPREEPIAVVGMATRFGGIESNTELVRAFIGLGEANQPQKLALLGMDDGDDDLYGFPINDIQLPLGGFRIPPTELTEMLPQQLLMLNLARLALEDAGLAVDELGEAGVFLGIGLDPNTSNFQLRWVLEQQAERWWETLNLQLDAAEKRAWIANLKKHIGPALNANRVIGALGGMVASRLARAFAIGGPSFTLSSEETSGLVAVEAAVRALRSGQVSAALAGAVDFACDGRSTLALDETSPELACDGGAVLILKRLADAEQAGDRIYGLIGGIGSANMAGFADVKAARTAAIDRAIADSAQAGTQAVKVQPIAWRAQNRQTTKRLGHAGAANGILNLVGALLALHHRVLPGSGKPQYWLRNRIEGDRQVVVDAIGVDGTTLAIQCAEYAAGRTLLPITHSENSLFFFHGIDAETLANSIEAFLARLDREPTSCYALAKAHWLDQRPGNHTWRLALVAQHNDDLRRQISHAHRALIAHPQAPQTDADFGELLRKKQAFFSCEPAVDPAKVAFLFPGSGSQFPEMGRLLGLHFPDVFDAQDRLTNFFRDQLRPDLFWSVKQHQDFHDQHRALLSAQVALGVTTHDLLAKFGVSPRGIIGYSLGESAGLFATRAWTARDEMHLRTQESDLFSSQLAGSCEAARKCWGLAQTEPVDWVLGVVNRTAAEVDAAVQNRDRVYRLIVNTPNECVIGGQRAAVNVVVDLLEARFFPLHGVVTVHCEVLEPAADAYHRHHLFQTNAPAGVTFYSGGWGRQFEVSRQRAADAILAQARYGVDFPKTIRAAYADGFRVFIEMGPGGSCTRMLSDTLKDLPHQALSVSKPGPRAIRHLLRSLGQLYALGLDVGLDPLFLSSEEKPVLQEQAKTIRVPVERLARIPPPLPLKRIPVEKTMLENTLDPIPAIAEPSISVDHLPAVAAHSSARVARKVTHSVGADSLYSFAEASQANHAAHQAFLQLSQLQTDTLSTAASFQMAVFEQAQKSGHAIAIPTVNQSPQPITQTNSIPMAMEPPVDQPPGLSVAFNRDLCLEFARGTIANVLGPEFAVVDQYPTRVRLPDEPLMLVDRIITIDGERMKRGRVVTEHDVKYDGWYLDAGRIPTCVAVEAGQADLFLSAYLGIDFETKGKANYRLLDAEVTFHDQLPKPGQVIRYDIHIDYFFRQGKTYLFRFGFEGSVDGKPLLTMRNGCAGFFSEAELAAGKGIVRNLQKPQTHAKPKKTVEPLVPMVVEAYSDAQLQALRSGDLATCFGPDFADLPLRQPVTLPDGSMNLVDRVLTLEPQGGPFGLGFIRAEADIHPDDWFLTCHFVDDKVMPGTLMYECCLHSLRIYLLRMGWIGETGSLAYQPVVGVKSLLKCRGQVLETTRKVRYEVMIKELGYDPEPYAIVDALMYSDERCIVEIGDMSIRLTGLTQASISRIWANKMTASPMDFRKKPALYDGDRILAFATGNPSEAFGEPYRVFDSDRVIARLPGPPLMLTDRITEIQTKPWQVEAGGRVQAQYDVPVHAWYFRENRQAVMPFAVLLEIALQPCGWMAAYMGSALTSDLDLKFRNLGGSATMLRAVTCQSACLTIDIKATRVSASGGMIIQNYDFQVCDSRGMVYVGDTYFGFFSKTALAAQVGLRDAKPAKLESSDLASPFAYPERAPYPSDRMRMLDRITCLLAQGGDDGLGFIQGDMAVDVTAWFFKAHFHQDPVVPGSLGLESFLQLLKVFADDRWRLPEQAQFETVACGLTHGWEYRGQVIPTNQRVVVEAHITAVDDAERTIIASGILTVDGTPIYAMKNFSLRVY